MKRWLDILQVNLLCDEGARDEDGDLDRLTLPKVAFEALGYEIQIKKTKLLIIEADRPMADRPMGPIGYSMATYDIDTGNTVKLASRMPIDVWRSGRYCIALNDNRLMVCSDYMNYDSPLSGFIVNSFEGGNLEYEFMSQDDCRKFACRWNASFVTLHDGRVMRIGGCLPNLAQDDCAIYDPQTKKWAAVVSATKMAVELCCVLLHDGRVLITGGLHTGITVPACWLYNPDSGEFVQTDDMWTPRFGHIGCLLDNGDVFVYGGRSLAGTDLVTAEVYETENATWRKVPTPQLPVRGGFCIQKSNGEILLVSFNRGWSYTESRPTPSAPVALPDSRLIIAIN